MTDGQKQPDFALPQPTYFKVMDELPRRSIRLIAAVVLLVMALMGIADLVGDGPIRNRWAHVTLEVLFLLLCLGASLWLFLELIRQNQKAAMLRVALQSHAAERDAWRAQAKNYLRGLGEAIAAQCAQWKLTQTESEVALLLLKGFSTKEIALLQSRSERTVRQHAISIYRKAQLGGRAELSAFFLEDLLLPQDQSPHPTDTLKV